MKPPVAFPAARVAVVYGGASQEAEVAQRSAVAVQTALTGAGGIATLVPLGPAIASVLAGDYDVVFPVAHGAVGEDGCLQGLLEVLEIPYVGSGVRASALAAYKPAAKVHFAAASLPLAAGVVVAERDGSGAASERVQAVLTGGVVVKPAAGGSAIGVTLLRERPSVVELAAAIEAARSDGGDVLVEEFFRGDEVTCGVLEDTAGHPRALPPTLVKPLSNEWYDFTARYAVGGSLHQCPAPYPDDVVQRIREVATGAHIALGARDLSRADFVVRPDGSVILLELNTLPGMTATSLFPEAAQVSGIKFEQLCRGLVEAALGRSREHALRAHPFPQ